MGIFGKKQIIDRPIAYHAGVIAALMGQKVRSTQLEADQARFGGAIASVLNLYSSTLGAPALLNMLAIGSGKEYAPIWDKEAVREVLAKSAESFAPLKESFLSYANKKTSEEDLINTIIRSMAYSAEGRTPTAYEEGLLFTCHQVLSEFAEKFQADHRNGLAGQEGTDAYLQGGAATAILGLLIACENANLLEK